MENKKRNSEEIKANVKKAAIIVLPVVFALVAAISAALLVGGARRAPEGEGSAPPASSSTPSVADVVVPPESTPSDNYSKGLEYRKGSEGICTVIGIGSCTDKIIKIPETSPDGEVVIGIGERAFAGKEIKEVRIPSSVMSMGEGAFAGCLSLEAINVDGANPVFSSVSGVLFDREMEELICYPSGREDATYVIPKSVTRISAMAFSSCKNLTKVKYAGTEKQWKDVYVCVGNDSLDMSKMTFAPEEK